MKTKQNKTETSVYGQSKEKKKQTSHGQSYSVEV